MQNSDVDGLKANLCGRAREMAEPLPKTFLRGYLTIKILQSEYYYHEPI